MDALPSPDSESGSGVRPIPTPPQACEHCGSPLSPGTDDAFCCAGCRHVHALLQSSGLTRYYQLRGNDALSPAVVPNASERAWLEAMQPAEPSAAARRFTLDVQGVQCGACVWLIETLFKRQEGAIGAQLNPALGRLSCTVGPTFWLPGFVEGVESFGYRLGPPKKAAERERDTLLLRTGIACALAGNAMFLGATVYFGLDEGPLLALIRNMSFGAATLSALIGGSYFVDRALSGVRRGVLHLDLPIAAGMLLAYLGSVWSHFFGEGRASYFDSVSVFIALMLVGRVLQERVVEKNRRQLLETEGASSLLARRSSHGRPELIPCVSIAQDDQLIVSPGEVVPVRARLEDDHATCTLDWINGEAEPKSYARGDALLAGAVNAGRSPIKVTAQTAFESSELDALLRNDDSAKQRLRGDFWDRVARYYVVAVLLATLGGAALWWAQGASFERILDVCTAILVVTCPCAFGIATPLAYELGVSGLRRRGLFVRDAAFFDRAARVRRIVFDKTGTLTTGVPELRDPSSLEELPLREAELLFALVAGSSHPKSSAVANALRRAFPALRLPDVQTQEIPGKGLLCAVDGVDYRFGEPSWALGVECSKLEGPVFAINGTLRAQLDSVEVPRPDAARETDLLRKEGFDLWIASGDVRERVEPLAERLGFAGERVRADLSPDQKHDLIARIDHHDTLMLGDGINDGPALSRAQCSGTPAIDRPFVPSRTDFYFLTPGLLPVRLALHVAKSVRRVVKNALVFAVLYNVIAVAIAYSGLMRPWLAAVLMPASSIAVLAYTAHALSSRRKVWKPSLS